MLLATLAVVFTVGFFNPYATASIGIGAIVMDGAVVGAGSIVGAGALVPPGMEIPAGVLAVGQPARIRRPLNAEEAAGLLHSAQNYASLARSYRARGMDQNS